MRDFWYSFSMTSGCPRCAELTKMLNRFLAADDTPTVADFMATRRHENYYYVKATKLHEAYLDWFPGSAPLGRTRFMRQVRLLGYRTSTKQGGVVVQGVLAS